jgi:hypothetical protein
MIKIYTRLNSKSNKEPLNTSQSPEEEKNKAIKYGRKKVIIGLDGDSFQ